MSEQDFERADLELVRAERFKRKRTEAALIITASVAGFLGMIFGVAVNEADQQQPEDFSAEIGELQNHLYSIEGQIENLCANQETIDHHIQHPGVELPIELPPARFDDGGLPGLNGVTSTTSTTIPAASPSTESTSAPQPTITTTTMPYGSRDPNVIHC